MLKVMKLLHVPLKREIRYALHQLGMLSLSQQAMLTTSGISPLLPFESASTIHLANI
jgi:hypothetical protein